MKILDTSSINDGTGEEQPVPSRSIQWLQQAAKEALAAFINGIINYTTGNIVIISGCVVSISGTAYSYTSGVIYYNGEVYLVKASSGTLGVGQIPLWQYTALGTTVPPYPDTAMLGSGNDPLVMVGGANANVHLTNTFYLVPGVSGNPGGAVPNYAGDYNGSNVIIYSPPSSLNSSSTTSLTLAVTNNVSATIGKGLSWVAGNTVRFTNSSGIFIEGRVVSYNAATGAMVFDQEVYSGTAGNSYTSWTVSFGNGHTMLFNQNTGITVTGGTFAGGYSCTKTGKMVNISINGVFTCSSTSSLFTLSIPTVLATVLFNSNITMNGCLYVVDTTATLQYACEGFPNGSPDNTLVIEQNGSFTWVTGHVYQIFGVIPALCN